MLNWRYVGKTFVNRDKVREQIFKEGPNSKPYRYIEKNDICRWSKAPDLAAADGRVVWLSTDGMSAKVAHLNRKMRRITNESQKKQSGRAFNTFLGKIPLQELTLLDINGNAAEHVEILYKKSGDPMRVSEKGVAIPYQDEVHKEKVKTNEADTEQRDLLKYGKHITELLDVQDMVRENIDKDMALEREDGRFVGGAKTAWKWVKNDKE